MKAKEKDPYIILEELYRLYEQKMYRLAYSVLRDEGQAEDAVQDAFCKIYEMLDKFKDPESVKTKRFIMKIVKNKAIDQYRRNRREYELMEEVKDETDCFAANDGKIRTVIDRELLSQIMNALPDDYKEVIVCRTFYELTVRETADVVGVSEAAVRKRFERAKKMIQNLSGENNNEKMEKYELGFKTGR